MRVAAIDVGTNTTRLLAVESSTARTYRELDRRLVFTRLGEGVDAWGTLREEAVERTLSAVAEFCAECGELGIERIRVAGTSALRDASNIRGFEQAVKRLTGSDLEVVSGEEEARLSFLGATYDLGGGSHIVCDIGGGSTELVLGIPGEIASAVSIDIGSVRLTERFLASDPPATEEILLMEGTIDQALVKADEVMAKDPDAELIGVAGTVTTLAAIHLGLSKYDPSKTHRMRMDVKNVLTQYRRVAGMTIDDRKKIAGMPEGRADVIVAGASILARLMVRWSVSEVIVSEKDILDGLVIDLLEGHMKGSN